MSRQADHSQPVVFDGTARKCPCCGVYSMGWPVAIEEGFSTEQWPETWRWVFRLDLRGFVCADCHSSLGEDRVRENLVRDASRRTALVPRPPFRQPPARQEAASV